MAERPAVSPSDRSASVVTPLHPPRDATAPVLLSDSFAKDAIFAWFRGEFAAANAIIDALCGHLVQVSGGAGSEYEAVLAAIHRRRLNWIPVLQMQKYHSIAEVTVELRKVTAMRLKEIKGKGETEEKVCLEGEKEKFAKKVTENDGEELVDDDSPDSEITDAGSQEAEHTAESFRICSNHEDCNSRSCLISLTKRFAAKEQVKGHMVNVVKGLKLYEDVFDDNEFSRLMGFVNELRAAGQKGELSGETFILFNKQTKGSKRELIQLGVPIFGHMKDEQSVNIEPIPALLQSVIDHLVQWQLIPEYKRPNGCLINFFEENEYSQPFLKPPHLDHPLSTLLLSEATMAFGHKLTIDNDGNYRGPLTLSLKEGSLLVMRGNSANMARHVMCPSPNRRVSITFFRVRPDTNQGQSPPTSPTISAMTLLQPVVPSSHPMSNGLVNAYGTMVLHAPILMLAPNRPPMLSPKRLTSGGTGVFLPWTVGTRKPMKHLPPRVQKLRLLTLPSSSDESTSREIGVR